MKDVGGNRLFRVWFNGEENLECSYAYIKEVVELGGGDYLLGLAYYEDEYFGNGGKSLDYYRLSDIKIQWFKDDEDDEN